MKKKAYMLAAFFIALVGLSATSMLSSPSVNAQFDPLLQSCTDEDGKRIDATVCNEALQANNSVDPDDPNNGNPIAGSNGIIVTVANLLAVITSVIAIIVIIVAGITMVLSSGESGKVADSRNAIIYAAVGLMVVALARSIVVFIVNRV